MLQRLNKGWLLILIIAQAAGLAIWWTWFNRSFFGINPLLGWLMNFFVLSVLYGLWYYLITLGGKRYFKWDPEVAARTDIVAGLPFIVLPFIILMAPWIAKVSALFPMKIISTVWMPNWPSAKVIGPQAYGVLMVSGLFIMGSLLGKVVFFIKHLYTYTLEELNPKHLFVSGLLILVILLSWPAITAAPNQGELSHLLVTEALTRDSAFSIQNVLSHGDFYRFYPHQSIEYNGYVNGLGRLFLPIAPGIPLLFMTFYITAGRWFLAVFTMLFAAGAASQLFGLFREQGYSVKSSYFVWLITLLTAPLFLYGYQAVEVTIAVFFLSWGLRLLMKCQQHDKGINGVVATLGFVVGLAWLGGIRFIGPSLIVLATLGYFLIKRQQGNKLILALLTMSVPAFLAVMFYIQIYSIFVFHPVYQFNAIWTLNFWLNLLAMITDRATGVLWHGPIWLLGLAGTIWLSLQKEKRVLPLVILLIAVSFIVFGMIMPDPRAEGSSFNRMWAAMAPLYGLGLVALIERLEKTHWIRKVLNGLVVYSWAVAVVLMLLPALTREAVRLKLLSWLKLDMVYQWLPSFGDHTSNLQLLTAVIIWLLVGYFIYRVVDQLQEIKNN